MTNLLISMDAVYRMFQSYAKKDGDEKTLSKGEFKAWLEAELPGFLESGGGEHESQCRVDELMHDLDQDGDGKMNFPEFIKFVTALTLVCQPGPCQGAK